MITMNPFLPALKIVKLSVKPAESRISITATPRGVIAWILGILGLGARHHLTMFPAGFALHSTSFIGETSTYCPLAHIATSVHATTKPVLFLALAIMSGFPFMACLISGLFVQAVLLLVVSLILLAAYFLSKERITLAIITDGHTIEAMRLMAKGEEKERLARAAAIMEKLLGNTDNGIAHPDEEESDDHAVESNPHEPAAPPPPPVVSQAASDQITLTCPSCGSQMRGATSVRGRNVRCPSCKQAFLAT